MTNDVEWAAKEVEGWEETVSTQQRAAAAKRARAMSRPRRLNMPGGKHGRYRISWVVFSEPYRM